MYQEKVVLCGANSYNEKYYFNEDFATLPDSVKDDLKAMCVLFVAEVGGILLLEYDEDGNLCFEVSSGEDDLCFDEVGADLRIKQIRTEQEDLLTSLELFYKVFFLEEEI